MSRTDASQRTWGFRLRLLVFAMSGILGVSLAGASPAPVLAADESTTGATADATVYRWQPYSNYGSASYLFARRPGSRFLVRFDLRPWAGKSIDTLQLQLTVTAGDASLLRVRRSADNWNESTVRWANRPYFAYTPVVPVTTAGTGNVRVDLTPFFTNGTVDIDSLSLVVMGTTRAGVTVASRESGKGPLVAFAENDTATPPQDAQPNSHQLRFYTPNIIVNDSGPTSRNTSASQLDRLFASYGDMKPVLDNVDVYCFFGGSVAKGDSAYDAMLRRAVGMLGDANVKLGIEVGGPLGYSPAAVYGGDRNGANGRKSALHDLATRVNKIEGMGGRVNYLMLDGALRRTIRNGTNSSPHAAFLTVGRLAVNTALTFRARTPGSQGNAVRIQYTVSGLDSSLQVSVNGTDVAVQLATNSAGQPVSTAAQVKAALESSSAASQLVSVVHQPGSNGTGVVAGVAATPLAWGDDGLNMSIQESAAEVVSYIRTMHDARPSIRFVLLEDVILWPYDGKAGYSGATYPNAQRPDFKDTWTELVRQLKGAGLMDTLVAMHNDVSVEYLDKRISSRNSNADDWYGRILKQQKQVEASGVAFGQLFNSQFGGNPQASSQASDAYFQDQVLHFVDALERYRMSRRPDLEQMDDFVVEAFMYYPRVITTSEVDNSLDDTYLDALRLYQSFVRDGTAATALLEAA